MQVFREGALKLTFPGDVRVVRWEVDGGYVNGLRRLTGTKTVDFFVQHSLGPALLEITDLRGHEVANRKKLKSDAMALEVAEKVRDSVAGMVWACERKLSSVPGFERLVHGLVNRERKLDVVLWLEEQRLDPATASPIAGEIEHHLRSWLNSKVIVTSVHLEAQATNRLQWVQVARLRKNAQAPGHAPPR